MLFLMLEMLILLLPCNLMGKLGLLLLILLMLVLMLILVCCYLQLPSEEETRGAVLLEGHLVGLPAHHGAPIYLPSLSRLPSLG